MLQELKEASSKAVEPDFENEGEIAAYEGITEAACGDEYTELGIDELDKLQGRAFSLYKYFKEQGQEWVAGNTQQYTQLLSIAAQVMKMPEGGSKTNNSNKEPGIDNGKPMIVIASSLDEVKQKYGVDDLRIKKIYELTKDQKEILNQTSDKVYEIRPALKLPSNAEIESLPKMDSNQTVLEFHKSLAELSKIVYEKKIRDIKADAHSKGYSVILNDKDLDSGGLRL